MGMLDLDLVRLQFEVLCIPLDVLARQLGLPFELLQQEAEEKGWRQLWDEDDREPVIIEEGEDGFSLVVDDYTDRTRKKLVAFSLAKEVLLSQKYLELEVGIITKAKLILDSIDQDNNSVAAVKALASLYKDMTKNSLSSGYNPAAISIGQDETGLPTVIVRDLTGQGQGQKK